ncbi:MAG: NnrU family protein, partial [Rubricella sp.]
FFKRLAPDARASMGDKGKGLVAVGVLAGVVLMVIGYRGAEFINVWFPPVWTVHLNNLLMLFAVILFGMGSSKGRARAWLRHPMLTGTLVFAIAHLLVNGDLASIVLFGALGVWAVLEMLVINAREPAWVRPEPGPASGDVRLVIISLVVFAVITGLHSWLGPWPFPG